ncbi:MAG: hypothetical protein A2086_08685 [Spirochaetes bacterium GWD1_27_9]|nr:MAG: hypothetical protein A2Z98_10235 [Spirochaetes bacterium GWB1_27_13]OHD26561.1 MAG: hypothetical protein A2Y34_07970 [Spirochaetes bacterium GWC1_27_15]OHD39973.1 MAG: hypothetical protein A2086_08685 [Spirochaetes bacterium GWD1_27_9]
MKNLIFFITLLSLLFFACGIENSQYYQAPDGIYVDDNGSQDISVKFYGYNQEKNISGSDYIFVGYDVYYYFSNNNQHKIANVRKPDTSINKKLLPFPKVDAADLTADKSKDKYPYRDSTDLFYNYINTFYQSIVTFPLTNKMIDEILKEGNANNVRFNFARKDDISRPQTSDVTQNNPYIKDEYVFLGEIYPQYTDYNGKTIQIENSAFEFGKPENNFLGFYDKDYYDYLGVKEESTDGDYLIYKVYFYIVARGFNFDGAKSNILQRSDNSRTFEVLFKVNSKSSGNNNPDGFILN